MPTEFDRFHNAMRILLNIDKPCFDAAVGEAETWRWTAFVHDPLRWFIEAPTGIAKKVWEIVEARQPGRYTANIPASLRADINSEDLTAPLTEAERAAVDADRELSAWVVSAYYSDEFSNTTVGEMRAMVRAKLREKAKLGPVTRWAVLFEDGHSTICEDFECTMSHPNMVSRQRVDFMRFKCDGLDTPSEWDQAIKAYREFLREHLEDEFDKRGNWLLDQAVLDMKRGNA